MNAFEKCNYIIDEVSESIVMEAIKHFNHKYARVKDDDARFLTPEEYKKFCARYSDMSKLDVEEVYDYEDRLMFYQLTHKPLPVKEYVKVKKDKKVKVKVEKPRVRSGKKVICVETGKVFDSCKIAAQYVGVVPGSINYALKNGTKCKGYTFNYYK